MTIAAAVGYSAISIFRHEHFGSSLDLAIQDQTIWGYSRLRVIPNTVEGIPNLLGDHFNPILVVLAPVYWVWNSPDAILVAQGILLAVAGIPIFIWGAKQLGQIEGLALQATYLVSWLILAGVLFDFHHTAFAVPAIAGSLYGVLEQRNRLLWAMVAVGMLTREDISLTLIVLGLYVAIFQRRWLLGGVLISINVVWFALLLGLLMPALAQGPYRHWSYSALGSTPASSAEFVLSHPIESLRLLVSPDQKFQVWIGLLGNWALLPVLSPLVLVAIPTFLERFWSSDPKLWSFHFQYSMVAAPILSFAAIDSINRIRGLIKTRLARAAPIVLSVLVLIVSAVASYMVVTPLDELGTYVSDATAAGIESCLQVIPPDASVAATVPQLTHLTHRYRAYAIPTDAVTDYIVVDAATQTGSDQSLRSVVQNALGRGYGVACAKELTVVLASGTSGQGLSPELQRWLAGACDGRACLSSSAQRAATLGLP